MTYIALIQKRGDFGNRSYMVSQYGETEEQFKQRVHSCYEKPYDVPYWDIEIYEANPI